MAARNLTNFDQLLFIVWICLRLLTLSQCDDDTETYAFLSIAREDETSQSSMKDIIGVNEIHILDRDRVYTHNCSFAFNLTQTRTNVVTYVWMSQAQSNSFGKQFTQQLRILQDDFTEMYVRLTSDNFTFSENKTYVFGGFVDPGNVLCSTVYFGLAEPTSINASGLFYRGIFTLQYINDTPLISVAIVFDNIGPLLRIESSNFIDLNCGGYVNSCRLTSSITLYSPKMSDFTASTVESYICSVMHSILRTNCENEHSTVEHHPFSFLRSVENSHVNAEKNGTASITIYFDFSTAADLSHYTMDGHRRAVSDVHVHCTKLDRIGFVNNTIVDGWPYSDEIRLYSKFEKMPHWIRLHVHLEIEIMDENDFGDYGCSAQCVFANDTERTESYGCPQSKKFSVLPHNWRSNQVVQRHQWQTYLDKLTNAVTFKNRVIGVTSVLACVACALLLYIWYVWRKYIKPLLTERKRKKDIGIVKSVLKTLQDGKARRALKYDVFLSYSSRDRNWVSIIYDQLNKAGYRVCFDEVDFPIGCSIPKAIAEAVSSSRITLAIVSPNYVKSTWTEFEYLCILTEIVEKNVPWGSLLPVLYKTCDLPAALKVFKYIDYAGMRKDVLKRSCVHTFLDFLCRKNSSVSAEKAIIKKFMTVLTKRLEELMSDEVPQNEEHVKVKRLRGTRNKTRRKCARHPTAHKL